MPNRNATRVIDVHIHSRTTVTAVLSRRIQDDSAIDWAEGLRK